MNSLKRLILILPILLLLVLVSPLKVDAAKKVDYLNTYVFSGSGTDHDAGLSIAIDSSNNMYITGLFQDTGDFDFTGGTDNHTSNGVWDIFVTKINSDGTYGYTKTFGGTGYDLGNSLALDSSNNVYISGTFYDTVDFDFTGGTDNHTSNGSWDVFVTKINADGTYGYTKTFGGTGVDWSEALALDSSKNIYVTGGFEAIVDFNFTGGTDNYTSNGVEDIFVTKINSDGTYGYTKTFGGTGSDVGYLLTLDSSNNIYVTGKFNGSIDFNFTGGTDNHTSNGSSDVFVTKINADGTYGYTKTFGGSGVDLGWTLALDSSNNIYVSGSFETTVDFNFTGGTDNHTSNGGTDVFITKINSDGTYGYTKTFGGISDDRGYSLILDSINNIYVTGYFDETVDFDPGIGVTNRTVTPSWNVENFVISLNNDGNFKWVKTFSSDQGSWGNEITFSNNKLYVTGEFGITTDFNPDGPSDIITTDPLASVFLTTYQIYTPSLAVTESGGTTSIVPNLSTDSVTLKLDLEPDSNVTVTLGSSDGSLIYSPSSLSFTTVNYSTPQTVTISSATPVGANTTKNMTFKIESFHKLRECKELPIIFRRPSKEN